MQQEVAEPGQHQPWRGSREIYLTGQSGSPNPKTAGISAMWSDSVWVLMGHKASKSTDKGRQEWILLSSLPEWTIGCGSHCCPDSWTWVEGTTWLTCTLIPFALPTVTMNPICCDFPPPSSYCDWCSYKGFPTQWEGKGWGVRGGLGDPPRTRVESQTVPLGYLG